MKKRIFTLLTCTIAGWLSIVWNADAMTYKVSWTSTRIAIPSNITWTTIKRCSTCAEEILAEWNPGEWTTCEIKDDSEFNEEALVCTHTYNNNKTYTIVYDGKGNDFENFSLTNWNVTEISDFMLYSWNIDGYPWSIKNIYLNNNKLTYFNLDRPYNHGIYLENIQLEWNLLTRLDGVLDNRHLKTLNLSWNKFTEIPWEITCKVFGNSLCMEEYYLILDDQIFWDHGGDWYIIDLSNNPIKWIRIEQADITQNSCHFERFWYSGWTSNFEYYYKLIDNPTGNIKKDWNTSNTEVTINSIGIWSYTFAVCIGNKLSKDCSDYLFSIDPPTYKLTIKYIYAEWGATAKPTVQHDYEEWADYSIASPTIEGYTADQTTVSGTMWNSDKTIIVRYTKNPEPTQTYTLTVNYEYDDWYPAGNPKTESHAAWEYYSITSPTISGYTADKPVVSWTMPDSNKTEKVIYRLNPASTQTYALTINYLYLDWGTQVYPPYTVNLAKWANYNFTPYPLVGYTASPNTIIWTMWNSDKEINVYYTKNSESTQTYTLTINYVYGNWSKAHDPEIRNLAAWTSYSITSPSISGFTPNRTVVSWVMPNWDESIDVTYSTQQGWITVVDDSNSSDLSLKVSNKTPDIDERVKLTINVNEKYTWKVYFPKMQYYNGSKRTTINNTSSSYVSDYSDELDEGEVQFRSSDDWSIIISRFVKFSRSGKFRIYAEDKFWDDTYVQINVADDDDDSSSSSNSSDESNLTLSANPTNPNINESINLTIKTDNYVGKIDLYAKYRDPTSSYRTTINNNSIEYFSDYSNVWENGYYKMTSSDKGKKTLSNLVEFKKPWTYRIYAEDKNWYSNFIQIYVNENGSISSSSQNDDEIQRLLNELLNKSNNSDLGTSTNTTNLSTDNNSYTDTDEEVYISRSCKKYRIQYNAWLWVFTSPDLKKAEYFINKDYFKRYIDSKNKQVDGCPTNIWWISTNYNDTSNNSSKYTAPNGKVYFINQESWWYKSNELEKEINAKKNFWSITDLKYFIRDRNPLINMDKVK